MRNIDELPERKREQIPADIDTTLFKAWDQNVVFCDHGKDWPLEAWVHGMELYHKIAGAAVIRERIGLGEWIKARTAEYKHGLAEQP